MRTPEANAARVSSSDYSADDRSKASAAHSLGEDLVADHVDLTDAFEPFGTQLEKRVGAELQRPIPVRVAARAYHVCAGLSGQLHGDRPDTAGGPGGGRSPGRESRSLEQDIERLGRQLGHVPGLVDESRRLGVCERLPQGLRVCQSFPLHTVGAVRWNQSLDRECRICRVRHWVFRAGCDNSPLWTAVAQAGR